MMTQKSERFVVNVHLMILLSRFRRSSISIDIRTNTKVGLMLGRRCRQPRANINPILDKRLVFVGVLGLLL